MNDPREQTAAPTQVSKSGSNPRYQVPVPVRLSFRTLSALAPGITSRLAWRLFAKPPRKPRRDRYGVFETARRLTVRAEGHELCAWEWGEGPTALLLHGWGSSARGLGAFVQPLLERGFRVVAYDAHAHGESPGVTTSGPQMARHLIEVAESLEARHLVAHSMGTVVAGFAIKRGLEPERMALLNAPADMPHFLSLFTQGLGFNTAVERRMIRRFEREHDIEWQNCVVEWVAGGASVPALLVHDDDDPDVPWDHAERVRAAWTNNHAITTRGMGHRGSLHSDEVIGATAAFLAGRSETLPEHVDMRVSSDA